VPVEDTIVHTSDDGRVAELQITIAELKLTVDGLEKERDFYFKKLREVEILCQNDSQSGLVEKNSGCFIRNR